MRKFRSLDDYNFGIILAYLCYKVYTKLHKETFDRLARPLQNSLAFRDYQNDAGTCFKPAAIPTYTTSWAFQTVVAFLYWD